MPAIALCEPANILGVLKGHMQGPAMARAAQIGNRLDLFLVKNGNPATVPGPISPCGETAQYKPFEAAAAAQTLAVQHFYLALGKKGAKKVLLVFCSWPARYAKEAKEQTMKGWTSTARTPVTW